MNRTNDYAVVSYNSKSLPYAHYGTLQGMYSDIYKFMDLMFATNHTLMFNGKYAINDFYNDRYIPITLGRFMRNVIHKI